MIIIIVSLCLFVLGVYLFIYSYDYGEIGVTMLIISGLMLLIYSIGWATSGYTYNVYVIKRNAFHQTLTTARINGNEYETAAIIKEVAKWNTNLAEQQYDNTTIFFDVLIDDRIDTLKPIE